MYATAAGAIADLLYPNIFSPLFEAKNCLEISHALLVVACKLAPESSPYATRYIETAAGDIVRPLQRIYKGNYYQSSSKSDYSQSDNFSKLLGILHS